MTPRPLAATPMAGYVKSWPAAPRYPWSVSFPADGLRTYQAIPARCAPPSGLIAVSRAPQSLPFANITCCMRVSFESGRETTSVCAGSVPNSNRQQPLCPLKSTVLVSLMQKPCGALVAARKPEPGCCCFGGMAYRLTGMILFVSVSAGVPVFSEDVLLSVHSTICFDV